MISVENLTKTYQSEQGSVRALDGVDLEVQKGEVVILQGPSGSGKTTLLLALGGMLRPSSGRISVMGDELQSLRGKDACRLRRDGIGFVFQLFHLIPYLDVVENVVLGARGRKSLQVREEAERCLDQLGLAARAHHRPSELSTGEGQRAALARALVGNPPLILADEPTGNLDAENTEIVLRHLDEYRRGGGTVVLVTHGNEGNAFADRVLHMRNGRLNGEP